MSKLFLISGYFKADGKRFVDYLVTENPEDTSAADEDIFYSGLTIPDICKMMLAGENTPEDFVITNFKEKVKEVVPDKLLLRVKSYISHISLHAIIAEGVKFKDKKHWHYDDDGLVNKKLDFELGWIPSFTTVNSLEDIADAIQNCQENLQREMTELQDRIRATQEELNYRQHAQSLLAKLSSDEVAKALGIT